MILKSSFDLVVASPPTEWVIRAAVGVRCAVVLQLVGSVGWDEGADVRNGCVWVGISIVCGGCSGAWGVCGVGVMLGMGFPQIGRTLVLGWGTGMHLTDMFYQMEIRQS